MKIIKKVPALLAALYLYLFVPIVVLYLGNSESDAHFGVWVATFVACFLIFLVAGIFNMVSAVQLFRSGSYNKLRSEMMKLKLGAIPFFVAEYVIFAFIAVSFSLLAVFFFWTVVGPFALILMVIIAAVILYVAVLVSSIYGIAFVCLLRKEKTISTGLLLLFLALQIIPIADIIVTIVLLSTYKERNTNTGNIS